MPKPMTHDLGLEWEFEVAQRLLKGNENAGALVTNSKGLQGRTYSHENYINGKIVVHNETGKLLCRPETLKLNGYID